MAATTGVLMALLTTDWSRATSRVPAGNPNITEPSFNAAERGPVFALTGLLWTLRTNTNEGFLRSSVADVADEAEAAGACCRVVGSEKSILPRAYGPALPAAGAFAGPGGSPMDGRGGRGVL